MSKIRIFLVKIFECPQRAPEVPRTWDQCRKMVFRSIFGEITNVFNSKNFGSKFSNVQKGPQRSLEHGIDVEKWFLDRFSAKLRMSKIRIFLVKIFECPQRAPEVPRTWDRCRKMVFRSIFGEITNVFNSKLFFKNFRMSKKGPRGLQNMGSMQKNGFQIDFRRNYECLKFEYFWSKFSNVHKVPQRSLEHGIDVEKWFLDRFSAKLRMSLIRKFLVKIFECPKRAPEVP